MERLAQYRFRPYLNGPRFCLTTYYTGRTVGGKCVVAYKFTQDGRVIFKGDDFHASPMHAVDSPNTAAGLMGFLTLRKGDTDAEYFRDYTPAQLEFSENHAETLACLCSDRWPDM